jgi:hypothetical protein
MTLENYLEELGVKINASKIDKPKSAPLWAEDSQAWRINLSYQGKRVRVIFYSWKGNPNKPSLASVVADLSRNYDSTSYTLKEFGDTFGWDSETASTYRAVLSLGKRFKRLFEDDQVRLNVAELANEY